MKVNEKDTEWEPSLQDYFAESSTLRLFEDLARVIASLGPAKIRVNARQIGFYRKTGFAYVWPPGDYLKRPAAPLVLTVSLNHRADSGRWKEIVEPKHGHFLHHLEVWSIGNLDDQIMSWLREAYDQAAPWRPAPSA